MKAFDKEHELDTTIQPVIDQLRALCEEHGLPFMVSVCYKRDDTEEACALSTTCGGGDGWAPVQMVLCKNILTGEVPLDKGPIMLMQDDNDGGDVPPAKRFNMN